MIISGIYIGVVAMILHAAFCQLISVFFQFVVVKQQFEQILYECQAW